MVFSITVNNTRIPQLAKALGYTGDPAADPAAFRTFAEQWIINNWKRLVRRQMYEEEVAKISISFTEGDIGSTP